MIAFDRRRVKAWSRRAKDIVRASPARSRRRPRSGFMLRERGWRDLRWAVPCAAFVVGLVADSSEQVLGFAALWTWCVLLFRVGQIGNFLGDPGHLLVFYQLPVSNDAIFRHQRILILRSSLWIGADWLAFGLGQAARTGEPSAWLAAPLIGFAQAAVALGLALWLFQRPKFPSGTLYLASAPLLWLGLVFAENAWMRANIIDPVLSVARHATPGGWLGFAAERAVGGQPWALLALVATGGVAAASIPRGFRVLQADFRVERAFGYPEALNTGGEPSAWPGAPGSFDEGFGADVGAEVSPARLPDPLAVRLALREALGAPAGAALFSRGIIERSIVRFLSERQRVLLDFLEPMIVFSWSRGWMTALLLLLGAQLLRLAGSASAAPVVLSAVALLLFALPTFGGGQWSGCTAPEGSPARTGPHALVPLGFWETAGVMLVMNHLRLAAAVPLLVLATRHGFTAAPLPWSESFAWALRIFLGVAMAQPIWVLISFFQDTSRTTWLPIRFAWIGLNGLVLAALTTCGFLVFVVPGVPGSLLAGLAGLGCAYVLLAMHGVAHRTGFMDLVRIQRAPFAS